MRAARSLLASGRTRSCDSRRQAGRDANLKLSPASGEDHEDARQAGRSWDVNQSLSPG